MKSALLVLVLLGVSLSASAKTLKFKVCDSEAATRSIQFTVVDNEKITLKFVDSVSKQSAEYKLLVIDKIAVSKKEVGKDLEVLLAQKGIADITSAMYFSAGDLDPSKKDDAILDLSGVELFYINMYALKNGAMGTIVAIDMGNNKVTPIFIGTTNSCKK